MKLRKVNVIIVTQYFETNFQTNSKKNSMVQPVVTLCQMCLNRLRFISNGSLTSRTDFESKLKFFTHWLQLVPMQLRRRFIHLRRNSLKSFFVAI